MNPSLMGWTQRRIQESTSFIRGRVIEDVASASLTSVGEVLSFGMEDGEVVATAFDGEHQFPVELHEGPEAACQLVMDQIQDGVIDHLGRPWPELVDGDGDFVGVLEPQLAGGIACWVLREVAFCAVGQLSAAVLAAGLRLR